MRKRERKKVKVWWVDDGFVSDDSRATWNSSIYFYFLLTQTNQTTKPIKWLFFNDPSAGIEYVRGWNAKQMCVSCSVLFSDVVFVVVVIFCECFDLKRKEREKNEPINFHEKGARAQVQHQRIQTDQPNSSLNHPDEKNVPFFPQRRFDNNIDFVFFYEIFYSFIYDIFCFKFLSLWFGLNKQMFNGKNDLMAKKIILFDLIFLWISSFPFSKECVDIQIRRSRRVISPGDCNTSPHRFDKIIVFLPRILLLHSFDYCFSSISRRQCDNFIAIILFCSNTSSSSPFLYVVNFIDTKHI